VLKPPNLITVEILSNNKKESDCENIK